MWLRSTVLGAVVAWGALAIAPALASAADRPSADTGAVTNVTATTATFTGTVNPNGAPTQYVFIYGANRYDTHTAVASAGTGTATVAVSVPITGLTPAASYHVRLIALNAHGFDVGHDVGFATPTVSGAPAPVTPLPSAAPPAPLLNSAPSSEAPPPPELGKSVNVNERSGSVMVKAPGVPTYVPLSQLASVPVGSIIDTRKGSVTLRTALPNGDTQSAVFHGGLFEVRQPKGTKGLTEVRMRGPLPTCDASTSSASTRAAAVDKKKRKKKRPPRRLWGRDNNGLFQTRGGNSVATVRGTQWFVEDRCDGTLTRVSAGSVTVHDLHAHRTVVVRAGHSYLARRTG
jgi:hypothetical protein